MRAVLVVVTAKVYEVVVESINAALCSFPVIRDILENRIFNTTVGGEEKV